MAQTTQTTNSPAPSTTTKHHKAHPLKFRVNCVKLIDDLRMVNKVNAETIANSLGLKSGEVAVFIQSTLRGMRCLARYKDATIVWLWSTIPTNIYFSTLTYLRVMREASTGAERQHINDLMRETHDKGKVRAARSRLEYNILAHMRGGNGRA